MILSLLCCVVCYVFGAQRTCYGSRVFCNGEKDEGVWSEAKVKEDTTTLCWLLDPPSGNRISSRRNGGYFFSEKAQILYVFGGWAFDLTGAGGDAISSPKNDLWKYEMGTNKWTLLYGCSEHLEGFGNNAKYPLKSADPMYFLSTWDETNVTERISDNHVYTNKHYPGGMTMFVTARGPSHKAAGHVGGDGTLDETWYVFGGLGNTEEQSKGPGVLDVLWTFSVSEATFSLRQAFSLMRGSGEYNYFFLPEKSSDPSFDTLARLKSGDKIYKPRSRYGSSGFSLQDGKKFIIFAGAFGLTTDGCNEIWEFDYDAMTWKLINGDPRISGDRGEFGSKGIFSNTSRPPARSQAAVWYIENTKNGYDMYAFGGTTNIPFVYWSDFWHYSSDKNEWRWLGGSKVFQRRPEFGTKDKIFGGQVDNLFPGSRIGVSTFTYRNDTLMMFGGLGADSEGSVGMMNDVWAYSIRIDKWIFLAGSKSSNNEGNQYTYPSGRYSNGIFKASSLLNDTKYYIMHGHSSTNIKNCSKGSTDEYQLGLINDMWWFDFEEKCDGLFPFDSDCCSSNGVCGAKVDGECDCEDTHKGDQCQTLRVVCNGVIDTPANQDDICFGHGGCSGDEKCECTGGYQGLYCGNTMNEFWSDYKEDNDGRYYISLDYQMQFSAVPPKYQDNRDGTFDCYDLIRRDGVDDDAEDLHNYLGIKEGNTTCKFLWHATRNISEALFMYHHRDNRPTRRAAGQEGQVFKVRILCLNDTLWDIPEEKKWILTRIRTDPEPETASYAGLIGGLVAGVVAALVFVVIVVCCCVCCCICCACCICCIICYCGAYLVCCACCILIYQKKQLRQFRDIDNSEVGMLLVEQSDLLKSDFKKVKKSAGFKKKLFNVNFNNLEVLEAVTAGGSNAMIFRSKYKGKIVALKLFKTKDIATMESYNIFMKEVNMLKTLKHPSFLRYHGATLDEPRVGIVLEWCSNGNIREYIQDENHDPFTTPKKLKIMIAIAGAMAYLNENQIMHRDLKWDNVMLDDKLEPKLIDFGLSKKLEATGTGLYMTRQAGTSQYMAPEVTLSTEYGFKCDVFSFGIMMYELLSDDFEPYGRHPEFNIELKVALNPDVRPPIDERPASEEECLEWVIDLMKRCWSMDSEERPNFSDIKSLIEDNLDETSEAVQPFDAKMLEEYMKRKEMKQRLEKKADDIDQT